MPADDFVYNGDRRTSVSSDVCSNTCSNDAWQNDRLPAPGSDGVTYRDQRGNVTIIQHADQVIINGNAAPQYYDRRYSQDDDRGYAQDDDCYDRQTQGYDRQSYDPDYDRTYARSYDPDYDRTYARPYDPGYDRDCPQYYDRYGGTPPGDYSYRTGVNSPEAQWAMRDYYDRVALEQSRNRDYANLLALEAQRHAREQMYWNDNGYARYGFEPGYSIGYQDRNFGVRLSSYDPGCFGYGPVSYEPGYRGYDYPDYRYADWRQLRYEPWYGRQSYDWQQSQYAYDYGQSYFRPRIAVGIPIGRNFSLGLII